MNDSNLVLCPKGHYYDASKNATCPYCASMGTPADATVYEGVMKGALSDEGKNKTLPETKPEGADGKTLTDIVKEGKSTVWDDGDTTIPVGVLEGGREPVVGWLVALNGGSKGISFPLKANRNFIGRGQKSDVALTDDVSVSRNKHAVVIYEPHERCFIAQPGESKELYYLNGKVVLNNETLKAYDVLEIGKTRLVFVPLCGSQFSWEDQNWY